MINASYMHVSGSRVMDKCTIGMCIMIKNICIAHASESRIIHTCIHASWSHVSGSRTYASHMHTNIKNHTYTLASESRIE